jgi:peptidyl-prolyl cis-trans isomerase D
MAVIQKLRNSGMVVIVVVAALVLFVIGDLLNSRYGSNNNSGDEGVIAEIGGKKFKEKEDMDPLVDKIYRQKLAGDPKMAKKMQTDEKFRLKTVKEIYKSAWDELIKNNVLMAEIEKSGITLSDADINEMLVGKHPSETMRQIPDFQTDGSFDAKKVEMIFKQGKANSELKANLLSLVESVTNYEKIERYATYISYANVKTKAEKEFEYIVANQGVTGSLINFVHNTVPEKDIKATDEDLQDYLNRHKEKYKFTQEARNIKYVVWDVVPTSGDTMEAYSQAMRTADGMRKQTEPDTFGALGFYNMTELPEDAPEPLKSMVWPAPINAVVGPMYSEGNFYIWQKVAEAKDTVPTVRASHILIPSSGSLPDGTVIVDSIMAESKAKEVYAQIMGGADIAALAPKFSTDQGSAEKGGDLGWAAASNYVPEFAAFCKTATKGQVGIVKTQFGFHIIKMMEEPQSKKIKYTQSVIELGASPKTVSLIDEKSRAFRNKVTADEGSFDKAVEKMALVPRVMKDVKTDNLTIPGIDVSADVKTVMYWLFDDKREKGEVSDVFSFANRHVVLMLENAKHIGYAKLDDVRSEIEPMVREELKGKKIAEKLMSFVDKAKTPAELARLAGATLIPIESLKMSQNFIPQIAAELKILGAMYGVEVKKFSTPVIGKSNTCMIWIDKRDDIKVPKSAGEAPDAFEMYNRPNYVMNTLQEVLTKKAHVQDYRYKYEWF